MNIPQLAARLTVFVLVAELASAQNLIFDYDGENEYGSGLAIIGDLDNDGFDEFAIGSSKACLDRGKVTVHSGRTGLALYEFFGPVTGDLYGANVKGGCDFDLDGVGDFMIAELLHSFGRGRVWVHSGVNGALLFTFVGSHGNGNLGSSLDCLGDVNGDGYPDIIAGMPGTVNGRVGVYSGLDGTELFNFIQAIGENTGVSVSGFYDYNDDGFDDFLVGASAGATTGGSVRAFSGFDASVLLEVTGISVGASPSYASFMDACDIDGDGIPDIIASAPFSDVSGINAGTVSVVSGVDGSIIHLITGDTDGDRLGRVECLGDTNGDGFNDFAVSTEEANLFGTRRGLVRVYSGVDASILYEEYGAVDNQRIGLRLGGGGDIDGDGAGDLLYLEQPQSTDISDVTVLSPRDRALTASAHEFSLADGGNINFVLTAGPSHANEVYWMFGSLSGTSPGLQFGSVLLPLNNDFYLNLTLTRPFAGIFSGFFGTLDGNGDANASLNVPANVIDPSLVGVTMHHAYLTAATLGIPNFASNAVPSTIQLFPPEFESEDFEAGVPSDWSVTGDWHLVEDGECGAVTRMLAFNDGPGTCDLTTVTTGRLTSPVFSSEQNPRIEFDYVLDLDPATTTVALFVEDGIGNTSTMFGLPNLDNIGQLVTEGFTFNPKGECESLRLVLEVTTTAPPTAGTGFLVDNFRVVK